MRSALRRGVAGAVGGALWLVAAAAVAPVADGHPLFGLAQLVIVSSPGWLATTFIDTLGKLAQPLLIASLAAGILVAGAVVGAGWDRLTATTDAPVGVLGGVLAPATAVTYLLAGTTAPVPLALGTVVTTAVPVGFVALMSRATGGGQSPSGTRRPFLRSVGVALAGAVGVGAAAQATTGGGTEPQSLPPQTATEAVEGTDTDDPVEEKRATGTTVASTPTPTPTATPEVVEQRRKEKVTISKLVDGAETFGFDFLGMPDPVTSVRNHYVVDTAADNPDVDPSEWSLSVGGAVDSAYDLAFDDLAGSDDAVEMPVTMTCISNPVGGGLVSTGRWRGIPLKTLVERAGASDDAVDVVTRSVDGYSEAIPWSYVREHPEILVVYGLNGQTLPRKNGKPARLLIPGRYGMKSTKWLDTIELSTSDHDAFWEKRGWDEEAVVNPYSYLRAVQRRGDRLVVGGVAFGGLDGVESVELSLDGGASWTTAELADPIGEYAWRHWRVVAERPPGEHDLVTRMTDGTGQLQTDETSEPHPGGSTGWHSLTVDI